VNRLAEAASQYLGKGKQVYIEGHLRLEEYIDRDGKPRQSLEVFATDMQFIGTKGNDISSETVPFAAQGTSF
jgi:single-strand DNA-binding protein